MFKKLSKLEVNEVEKEILNSWGSINQILNKTIENRNGNKNFVFYDGPATANGHPGLHHMVAKFLKDSFCKYQTMQGNKVLRKVGWDTHGLPVEVQVEKELGFTGKQDIEKYGIEKFNKKCRENVWKNEETFSQLTTQMGQFIDLENPYVTYQNDYIETEWWILKKFFDEGLFYQGTKILPFCSRCGTGLASHEVAQGYKEVTVDTVIVPFKKKEEDIYFLVWTTTPWTLISNVALCVNPNEDYQLVESKGNKFIAAKALISTLFDEEVTVLENYKGSDLEYMEYEQLIPELNVEGKAFYVTNDTYVTMESGTGIVHIAPAFGEDDAKVGRKYKLPYVNPVGENGCYTEGPWKDINVFAADLEVIKYLKSNDKLFKKQKMLHNYPHCWRCDTPLIYYSKPSYYLEITKIKDKIIEANKKVNWYPSYVGEKRFGNWLENLNDWAISRNRYWGTPLPLWKCSCQHEVMIGSREELIEKATTKLDKDVELHRPVVDDIHIKCDKCGKDMHRVTDVIDCWFDSGSMPFAQYHYPFENQELFETQFPADFISEGIDQTRGWFYSLLVISVFVKGVAPFKNVLVNDLLLDSEGKKMSKSKGNIVEPFTTIKEYGADTVRFYLPYTSPVWMPLKFSFDGLKEVYSKYISTFKNAYSFFEMYANADNIDPREYSIKVEDRELIDKWLISKLNKLVKEVTTAYEEYDLNKVTKLIIPFLNDDLSNWYIRSNRRRFWDSELSESKKAVYLTTYEVLLTLTKLTAPITPFITEEIYKNLTDNESVHLEDFPKYDENLINEEIEKQMDLVRDICSLGRFAREEANIKVRQPIKNIIIPKKDEEIIGNLTTVIQEELNVKEIEFIEDMSDYLDYVIKPNFKVLGKTLGPKIKLLQEKLQSLTNEDIKTIEEKSLTVTLDDMNLELTKENTLISVIQKDGYASSSNADTCVVLNTELTEDLILEGYAREVVRTIQALRKDMDLVITDNINVIYNGNETVDKTINIFNDYIKTEVLAINITKDETLNLEQKLNDIEVSIKIEKN